MRSSDNLKRGAAYVVASAVLFAGMGAIVRILSAALPNEMVVFFRSAMGLVVLLPWLWHSGLSLKTRHLKFHLVRGIAGLTAMYCFFYAIAHLPLAEATLYNYSTPLWVPFIAFALLREPIPRRLAWDIGIGFVGIVLILKPAFGGGGGAALIGLASGVFAALAMVGIRRLTRTEPATRIVFYFSLICTVVSAVPLTWAWRTPEPTLWLLLLLLGVFASGGQLLLTRGYAHAPAAQVGPFTYSTVVFAAVLGWFLWGDVFDALSVLGAGLVCLGGVLAIRASGKHATPAADLPDIGGRR